MAEEEASNRTKVRAEDLPFVATYYYMMFVRASLNASSRASLFMCVKCKCWFEKKENVACFCYCCVRTLFMLLNASKNRERKYVCEAKKEIEVATFISVPPNHLT